MNAPRAMQLVEGDFTIQVKTSVIKEPQAMENMDKGAFCGAGLLIRKDFNSYIRLDREIYWDGNQFRSAVVLELNDKGRASRSKSPALDFKKDVWLKMERKGNVFRAFYLADGRNLVVARQSKHVRPQGELRLAW